MLEEIKDKFNDLFLEIEKIKNINNDEIINEIHKQTSCLFYYLYKELNLKNGLTSEVSFLNKENKEEIFTLSFLKNKENA